MMKKKSWVYCEVVKDTTKAKLTGECKETDIFIL